MKPARGTGFALREAGAADIAAIAAIYAHHVRTGFGTFDEVPPAPEDMLERQAQVLALGLPYLVAVEGGRALGYAYAAPHRPRSGYRFTVEDSIYIAPAAQRRGIGTALLSEVVARSATAGMKQMVAVIGGSANLASIAVHEKCGFRPVGTFTDVGFKHGRWVDAVMMQRAL
jgi:L-amino acid N-acyltransferase YncA